MIGLDDPNSSTLGPRVITARNSLKVQPSAASRQLSNGACAGKIGQGVATSRREAVNLSPAMMKFRHALVVLALLIPGAVTAQGLLGPVSNEDQFLPVDQAFVFTALADGGDRVLLDWQVAPGYYLYRHRTSAKTETPGFALGDIAMPEGRKKTDEFFGDVEVYYGVLSATVPVTRPEGASSFEIQVSYQGCADAGLCYPPVTKTVAIELPPPGTPAASEAAPMVSEQDGLAGLLVTGSLFAVFAAFWVAGLLLSYTPCVLPMVPILSGIIAGQGASATPARSFLLS